MSQQGINKWILAGKLPAEKFGNRWMIPVEAIQAKIDDLNSEAERRALRG